VIAATAHVSPALPVNRPSPPFEALECEIDKYGSLTSVNMPSITLPDADTAHRTSFAMSRIGVNGTQCRPESAFAKNLYRRIEELCGLKDSNQWHYGANKGVSRIAIGPADWQAGWICPNSRLPEVGTLLEEWKAKDTETGAPNVLRRGVLAKLEEGGLTIKESAPWYAPALRDKAGIEISSRSEAPLLPDAAGEQQGDTGQQTYTTKAAAIAKVRVQRPRAYCP
jgi:hypothetical protein